MEILITDDSGTYFNPTLLRFIEQRKEAVIVPVLLKECPCNLSDSAGMTLLHFAAEYGHAEFAQYLLNLGFNVDVQSMAQETPLFVAVENNQVETVKVLLEANANIFVPNILGRCALAKALNSEKQINGNIVKALLSKVTSEYLKNSECVATKVFHRDCPLYHFIALNDPEITRVLLEKGSPVDATSPANGNTALHIAVKRQDWENMKVLVRHNASVEIKNHKDRTPWGLVRDLILIKESNCWDEILDLLKVVIEAGHDYNCCESIVHRILMHGNREIVREALPPILQLYANSPPIGEDLLEPLFYLCMNQTPDILEELRGFNFDVNAYCNYQRTMLHCAAQVGNPSSVKFLLDRGAYVNAIDREGSTPLRRSILFILCCNLSRVDLGISSVLNCIDILLDHGADPQIFVPDTSILPAKIFERKLSQGDIIMLFEPILTRVALLEVDGPGVETFMRSEIKSLPQLESIFLLNKQHLEEIKTVNIDRAITLLDFFVESEEKASRFALNKRLVSNVNDAMKKRSSDSYCHRKLHERLLKMNELVALREKVATTLNEILAEICDISVYHIAEKIVSFVRGEDLYKMV